MLIVIMPTVVVDASAIAALLFGEPRADDVGAAIDGCDLIAPRLLRFEIISVGAKKLRADPQLRDAVTSGLQRYMHLAIEERDVPLQPVLYMALDTGLSTYDAAYLWLARRDGLSLITLDAELAAAAR